MSIDEVSRRSFWNLLVPLVGMMSCCIPGCVTESAGPVQPTSMSAGSESDDRTPEIPSPDAGVPVAAPGLKNLVAYHPGFVSGSAPNGAEGFATLADLGVRTVISVDGAEPEVEIARARGMRYIHLPVGYDGFGEERRRQMIRAVLDGLELGAVYIHCHHGMHRSAGAAAAVVVGAGWATPDQAIERMRISGTSRRYQGLYQCAARSIPIDTAEIEAVDPDFPEVDRPDDFVEMMIEMDLAVEHLGRIAGADWRPPESHPDLVPAAEAGRLADLLRIASEGRRAAGESDADFAARLGRQSDQVSRLESLLLVPELDPIALDRALAAVRRSCISCHIDHRD